MDSATLGPWRFPYTSFRDNFPAKSPALLKVQLLRRSPICRRSLKSAIEADEMSNRKDGGKMCERSQLDKADTATLAWPTAWISSVGSQWQAGANAGRHEQIDQSKSESQNNNLALDCQVSIDCRKQVVAPDVAARLRPRRSGTFPALRSKSMPGKC